MRTVLSYVLVVLFVTTSCLPMLTFNGSQYPSTHTYHLHYADKETATERQSWYDAIKINRLINELGQTKDQLNAVTADRDALKQQVDAYTGASVTSGLGGGTRTNHFIFGQCTYYVASKRYVPWFGDAGTWLIGAAAYGFSIGSTPRVGAIMVSAEGWYGHVAYVEQVNTGSFVVSEMNFNAWNAVDRRTVVLGTVPIKGFIY